MSSSVTVVHLHSTIPSGSFLLEYTNPDTLLTKSVDVPYNADKQTIRDVFQKYISPEINVISE